MSIESELARWAKTPDGKDALMQAKNKRTRSMSTFEVGLGDGSMSLEDIVDEVISVFNYYIEEADRVGDNDKPFDFGRYLDWSSQDLIQIGDELVWEVSLNFDREGIHRDSWYPEGYPFGAYDIVQLINNGYSADNYVYKDIDVNGKKIRIRSLRERDGAHFMNIAEAACNERGETKGYWVEIHPRFVDDFG